MTEKEEQALKTGDRIYQVRARWNYETGRTSRHKIVCEEVKGRSGWCNDVRLTSGNLLGRHSAQRSWATTPLKAVGMHIRLQMEEIKTAKKQIAYSEKLLRQAHKLIPRSK